MKEPFTHFMDYAVNGVLDEMSLDNKTGALGWM